MSDIKYRVFIKDWKTENEKNISGSVIIKSVAGPKKQATGEMTGFSEAGLFMQTGPFQTEPSFSTTNEKFVEELINIFYSKIIEQFQVDLGGRLSYELESSPTPSGLTPSGLTPSGLTPSGLTPSGPTATPLTDTKSSELKNIIFNVQKEGIFSNAKFGELRLIGESLVNENSGFDFSDEDDLSGLLLDDEFREEDFEGMEELSLIAKEPPEKLKNEIDSEGEKYIDNPLSNGEAIDTNWFNHNTKEFIWKENPMRKTFYKIIYIPVIDPSKMPNPTLSKQKLIDTKLKVEGGLTGDPNDSASKKGYCPTLKDGKKYHTNKGITYAVWKSIFGTSNDNRFLNMNHTDWVKVFDTLYWNKHGKSSKYESVNALIVSFAWGGSKNPTIKGAKKILGVSDLDSKGESEVVAALISARAQLFLSISQPNVKNNSFRKGWFQTAMNAFVKATYV